MRVRLLGASAAADDRFCPLRTGVVGGMEPKLKKTKRVGKDEKNLSKLDQKELNDLEKWLEENSMKENSRSFTLADIAMLVAST